jgi:hypothetical protein
MVMAIIVLGLALPNGSSSYTRAAAGDSRYILVGGQNGTWFESGQTPRLERVDLANYSVSILVPASGGGVVWTGGWNGSQWLITGFGTARGPNGSNPYLYLYDGQNQITGRSEEQYAAEASWHGGDIFGVSYNGAEWLLSGMGSDVLPTYSPMQQNHMSLATFNGNNFTDLSSELPDQRDAILYANAWNGKTWLVGGGYSEVGILFSFNGSTFDDLTPEIRQVVSTFGSVQSIAWNGEYWLIGGFDFLAKYDGSQFSDLTPALGSALGWRGVCCYSVNALAWNGAEWMIGGGAPVAQFSDNKAWVATYSPNGFEDLSANLGAAVANAFQSSILTITSTRGLWILGGYANDYGILYSYDGTSFTKLFNLVSNYTYVNWLGAGMATSVTTTSNPNRPVLDSSILSILMIRMIERLRVPRSMIS